MCQRILKLSAFSLLSILGVVAQAQNWSGGSGTNNFNNAANWDTLPTNGSTISFSSTNGNLVAPTFTLNNDFAALSLNGISFNNDGNVYDYTLTGNGVTLTANSNINNTSGNLQTINFNIATATVQNVNLSSGNLTLGGVISGAGGLSLNGPGTLTLNNANTNTGLMTVSSGVLQLGNANAVATTTVSQNATNGLAFTAGIGTFNVAGLTGGGSIALSDPTGNQNVTLSVGGTNTTSAYTGTLTNGAGTGVGSLTKVGTGTFSISGANTYTGLTTVSAGTLQFAQEAAFYNNNHASWTAANFVVAANATAAFNVGGGGEFTAADIQIINAVGNGTGGFQSGSTLALDTTNAGGGFTYGTAITNAGGNTLNFAKLGTNTLTLSAANTYTGTTTVNAGILEFAQKVSLYNNVPANWTAANLVVNNGAVAAFNVGGAGEFTTTDIQTLSGLGTATGGFRNGASIGIDTTNVASGTLTYGSVLANPNAGANALGLTKLGNNTLVLSAANTFSGTTAINGGTLMLTNSLALQNSTLNYNNQGGNLDLGTLSSITVGGLAGGQGLTLANDNTLPVNLIISNGNGATYSGSISGTNVTVTKNGAGAETFSGGSSFTGTGIVNAGTLTLGGAQSNAAWTVNGGTLSVTTGQSAITNYVVNGGALNLLTVAQTTNADFQVNSGTVSVAIGQGAQSTFELKNGAVFTTTQSLGAGNIITAVSGTTAVTTTALSTANVFNGTFAGNGNINMTFSALLNTVSANMLSSFGGVFSLGAQATNDRVAADTSSENFLAQFATLDLGTNTGSISVRNANDNVELGALTGGSGTALGAGSAVYTIGSNNASTTFAGKILTVASLVKVGTGTLTLTDAGAGAFTAANGVIVNGGTLKVDYTANPTGVFPSQILNIGGGSLYLLGKSASASSQTLGNVTLTGAGGNSLIVDPNGGTFALTLGTITSTANGGTLNIQPPNVAIGSGTATITTTTDVAAGAIYSPRLTYGSDWVTGAAAGVSTLSAYTGYNNLTTSITAGTDTTNDRLNDVGSAALAGAFTTNSLKINNTTAQSLSLAGNALTLTSGGLLFAGSQPYSIGSVVNDGTLKSGSTSPSDLILQQLGTGNLTINSTITNGAGTTNASVLTKAGFGTVILTGANAYTGVTNLNGGILSISSDGNIGGNNGTIAIATSLTTSASVTLTSATLPAGFGPGSNLLGRTVTTVNGVTVTLNGNANTALTNSSASWITGANLDMNGGTLQATGSFSMSESNSGGSAGTTSGNRPVLLFGGGGTIDVTAGNNLTIPGVISENNIFQLGSLKKTDAGTLTLTGANNYGGATVISGGVLSINNLANGGVIAASGSGKTTASGSPTVSILNTTGIIIGQSVIGNGVPAGATVTAITPNTNITLSVNATASSTSPLTFFTPNGLGSSPSLANALVFDGGTLQYTGPATSTDRTFTLTNNGGAIDGSGSGPVTFSNTSAVIANNSLAGSGPRTLTLTGTTAGNIFAGQLVDGVGGTGLTKSGAGTWALTNTSHTYTGNTTVSGGTLLLSAASTNNIASSANIKVGGGSTLDVTGLSSGTLALGSQTLTGAGTITGAVLSTAAGNIKPGTVTAGSAGTGTLSIGSLSLVAGTTLNFGLSNANLNGSLGAGADLISTGALTLPGSGTANIELFQPNTNTPFITPGVYDLIQFSSLSGIPSSSLLPGGITGNGAFSYAFGTSGNFLTVTLTQVAVAASWNVDANGNWSAPGSWIGGVPGSHAGDSATFGTIITLPRTVTLDANETVGQIVFNTNNVANPTASYTIAEPTSGGPFAITLNNNGSGASILDQSGSHAMNVNLNLAESTTISVSNASDTLTIAGTVNSAAGTPNLTKTGQGTLVLSNTGSNYAGSTNINGGALQFAALGSLGSGSAINFGGGTLKYASGNTADISARTVTLNAAGGTIDTNGNNVTFANPIGNGGSGGLTKIGAGTLTFAPTALSTYTGNTTISGGTVNFSALGNLGAGTGINLTNAGTLQWATGTTTNISTRNVTLGAGGGTFDANGNAISFTAAIGNGGAGSLTLSSSAANGSFAFSQASTYTGGTTINQVPVTLNTNGTLSSGPITFLGTTGSIISTYTAGRVVLPTADTGSGVVGNITGTATNGAGVATILSGLTGSGVMNVVAENTANTGSSNASGVLFSGGGYNTFTGTINISSNSSTNNAAVLYFNTANGVAAFNGNMGQATVNLTSNVRLSATNASGGNTWTVGALSGDSTAILAGSDFGGGTGGGLTALVGGLNSNSTFAGTLVNGASGALTLTKQGTGTLTLTNGGSTTTGTTTINAGTLKIMNATGSATGFGNVTVNSTGILAGTGIISGQGAASPVNATVTVASGGHIAPGDPSAVNRVGTISMDAVTLNTGSLLDFEFNGGLKPDGTTNNDVINVTSAGGANITAANLNLFNGNSAPGTNYAVPGTYDLLEYNPSGGAPNFSTLGIASPQPNTLYSFGTADNVGTNHLSFVTLTISSNPVIFWALDSDGQWGTDTTPGVNNHWSSGTNPNLVGAQVAFDDTHTTFNSPHTVTLNGTPTVGSILFNSAKSFTIAGPNSLNIDNGILLGSISNTKGAHTITAPVNYTNVGLSVNVTNAADTLTLSGGLSGSGPLAMSGAGSLVLAADDSGVSGATTVSSGSVQLGNANALANSIVTLSGGTLTFSPGVGTVNVPQINGGTAAQSNVVLQDTVGGAVNLALGGTGLGFTYAGVMSGPGSLTKNGGGTLTLTGVNTFAGNLTVGGGVLAVNALEQNGGNVAVNGGATLTLNSGGNVQGTITLNNQATFNMAPTSNSVFPGNNIVVPAGATASITSAGQANIYAGLVSSGDSTSVLQVGTNVSFGGTTDILANFAGTVNVGNLSGLIRWFGGATDGGVNTTFDLGGSGTMFTKNSETIDLGALVGTGGSQLTGTSGGANQATTWSIGAKNISTEFDGVISGSTATQLTSIVKVGTGTLTLGGANTYAGSTRINQGTLALGTQNAISSTSQVIFSGGKLNTLGNSQDFTTAASPAVPTTINVTANSTLDLGATVSSPPEIVKFANSSAVAWTAGAILRISDWHGTPISGSASDIDQLIIGADATGLSSTQALQQIHFTGFLTGANVLGASSVNPGEVVPSSTTTLLHGDVNQDHQVNVADISALMSALSNLSAYDAGLTTIRSNNSIVFDSADLADVADLNGDGQVNNADIQGLITYIANGGTGGFGGGTLSVVPEPSSLILLALGMLFFAVRQYRRKGYSAIAV